MYKKVQDAEKATDFTNRLHLMGEDISETRHRHAFAIEGGKYQVVVRQYYARNLLEGTAVWKNEDDAADSCWEKVGETWQHLDR